MAGLNNPPSQVTADDWLCVFWRHVHLPWAETIQRPLWKAVRRCSAVMRLNLCGLTEAHVYPLVSPWSSSQWTSHTQQHSTLTSPGPPCHKHVHLSLGLMSASLEDHGGSAVPLYPAFRLPEHWTCGCNLDKCMQGQISTCKEAHTCSLQPRIHAFHFPPPSLCVVASWWVQLEFHTQLGSNSNGDWHVPVNPLHTTAAL